MTENIEQIYQNKNKRLKAILFLLIALFCTLMLVFRPVIFFGKATYTNTSPIVLDNSYLFASPLQARADNQEMIRLTAFLLDGRGLGVGNQLVTLTHSPTLQLNPTQPYTDETGKAVFDIHTPVAGTYYIEAIVGSRKIPQKIKLIFY